MLPVQGVLILISSPKPLEVGFQVVNMKLLIGIRIIKN